jgi:hypothetical protein
MTRKIINSIARTPPFMSAHNLRTKHVLGQILPKPTSSKLGTSPQISFGGSLSIHHYIYVTASPQKSLLADLRPDIAEHRHHTCAV